MAKRPVDIRRLRPTQLLRLLNSTALGPVMTRIQLRRQLDAAAGRVDNGETVHLDGCAWWLGSPAKCALGASMPRAKAPRRPRPPGGRPVVPIRNLPVDIAPC